MGRAPDSVLPAESAAYEHSPQPRSGGPLRLPLEPAWRVTFAPRSEWALLPATGSWTVGDDERVFIAAHGRLTCRAVADGAVRWRAVLSFTPTWLARTARSVIVGGTDGLARLSDRDGRPIWEFRVPVAAPWLDAPGWRDPDAAPAPVESSGFQLAGGRLFAWLGLQSLVAWDAETGAVLWQRAAPDAGLRPAPFGRFHPRYHADAACAVVQTADGRRWVLDAATGHIRHDDPAPDVPWPGPPLALDGRRLLVVEDQRVVALDRAAWQPAWTFDLPRWPSLSGELPQTRLAGGTVLVGVSRNDCFEVERLDHATGRRKDPEPVVVGRESVDLAAIALDGDTLYVATEGELRAIDCRQNRVTARLKLEPAPAWRAEPAAGGLLLWAAPVVSALAPPPRGGRLLTVRCKPELRGDGLWPAGSNFGPRGAVRVVGNEVVVALDGEIRGYRGASREAK
jgi:outer membrane protein assembly factor BamB